LALIHPPPLWSPSPVLHGPIACYGEMKNGVNGCRLDDRGECLVEVDPRLLLEATNDPSGLATLEGTIEVKLVLEHPFARDDVRSRRTRHERPSLIVLQSVELELHYVTPVEVPESRAHRGKHLQH
jgi:hypothetical protein